MVNVLNQHENLKVSIFKYVCGSGIRARPLLWSRTAWFQGITHVGKTEPHYTACDLLLSLLLNVFVNGPI